MLQGQVLFSLLFSFILFLFSGIGGLKNHMSPLGQQPIASNKPAHIFQYRVQKSPGQVFILCVLVLLLSMGREGFSSVLHCSWCKSW